MGMVEAVCISEKKGMVKKEVPEIHLEENWGITGDAHAGIWHRQVSLLAGESIEQVKKKMPHLKHGVFAENIVSRGVELTALAIGDRLIIDGTVVLEVTQIGKECHNAGCAIKKATGDCIMPREGIFTKVIHGGVVKAGLAIAIERISEATRVA
ncbi:MOSC domain-containing protein [Thiovibrio frasassiensis]|uniref:MOSC domain-containing protein n=1 Tax=Thiovibrio frasassiensis TaxID=2984131 RepID=A0A9X4RPF8_9BACT|nr:MOSC domain-containing protein [Thiovibrio frasassiensis]MDG4475207.1 MOSC domain-containing protein [Thiovibrio frasassiensis]